jgi:hypothetical protein
MVQNCEWHCGMVVSRLIHYASKLWSSGTIIDGVGDQPQRTGGKKRYEHVTT